MISRLSRFNENLMTMRTLSSFTVTLDPPLVNAVLFFCYSYCCKMQLASLFTYLCLFPFVFFCKHTKSTSIESLILPVCSNLFCLPRMLRIICCSVFFTDNILARFVISTKVLGEFRIFNVRFSIIFPFPRKLLFGQNSSLFYRLE